ncbi:MAG: response regulator [Bacteroidota bacterium]|jgi:PleD family two-component response regulator
MISDYLKLADKFILRNDFDAAEYEVNKALKLDPGNRYALAYLDRVRHFRQQYDEKRKSEKKGRIVIIDDERDYVDMLRLLLSIAGYEVVTAFSPEEAMKKLPSSVPDLILCDIHFDNSELDGFSVYEHVRTMPELLAVPFIFITGVKDEKIHTSSLEIGVDSFIVKPFSSDMLLAAIEGKIKRFGDLKKTGKDR